MTINTNTSSIVNAPVIDSTSSAYAKYLVEKDVTGVAIYLPNDLVKMIEAARPGTKLAKITRDALVAMVNNAGLVREGPTPDGSPLPWTWVEAAPARKLTAKEELANAKAEAEKARLEVEAMKREMESLKAQMVPTPPQQKANAKGQIVAA